MNPRSRAFLWHLGLTSSVLLLVTAAVLLLWYPAPYFEIAGAGKYLLLMIGLVIGLGPLLTLVIYKPGKKGLLFDLVVIALFQLGALAFTSWTLYAKRPYFMVFAQDRFDVLTANNVDFGQISDSRFLAKPSAGPVMLVAWLPDDAARRAVLTRETMLEGKPDIERRPEFWHLYSDEYRGVLAKARRLQRLIDARPSEAAALEAAAMAAGVVPSQAVFHPVLGRKTDFAAILDPEDGAILAVVAVNPWL